MAKVEAPKTKSASLRGLHAPGWRGSIVSPPLFPGEDGEKYAEFTTQFLAAAKPRDSIEEILAREAIDLIPRLFDHDL
jgi:hypothetical protein